MNKNYIFFVYETTNLINGKTYIGCHRTTNINDGYLGSGTLLQKAIKKYGKENFSRKILVFCDSLEEMFKMEISLISDEYVLSENTYNVRFGGWGGKITDVTKKTISNSLKGRKKSEETKKKMSIAQTGRKKSEKTKKKISEKGKNRVTSNKTKEKLSLSAKQRALINPQSVGKGSIWITNGIINKRIYTETIPDGWYRGRTYNNAPT